MRIKKLELKNFRGFEELTIDFPEGESGLAVFVGVNGAGKSSILDAVNNLLFYYTLELFDQPNEGEKIIPRIISASSKREDVKVGKKEAVTKLTLLKDGIKVHATEDIESSGSKGYNVAFEDGNGVGIGNVLKEVIPQKILEDRKKLISPPSMIAYYPADRSAPSEPHLEAEDISKLTLIDIFKNAFDIKFEFNDFFKWYRNVEDLENEEIRRIEDFKFELPILKGIRAALETFLNGVTKPRVTRVRRERFVVEKNGQELSIANLSHGERLVFAMVGDIARRLAIANLGSNDSLKGEGVVLIDEIEQHLHPGWQRTIIPNLRRTFPNIQFILTTHSPQVLSTLKRENVFILQDFKLVKETPHTLGRDSNSILWDIFGVEKRPPEAEKEFSKLYRLMDDESKVKETENLLRDVEERYGYYDEEVVRARAHFQFLNES